MTDRIVLVLKYDDWPQADRDAWDGLFLAGDLFDDLGPCHAWSEGSRTKRRQSYGQWLSFLRRTDDAALTNPPTSRIVVSSVQAYVAECKMRLSPRTIQTLVTDLYVLAAAMSPHADLAWLNTVVKRLGHEANRHSLPAPHPIDARRIFQWSLHFMEQIERDSHLSPKKQAIHFRQALLIGFLIACPIRRRTLLAMRVKQHLRPMSVGFMLQFAAEDMKDHKARSFRLPTQLVAPMRAYLDLYRPALLEGNGTDALWVNQYGDGMTPDGLSRELPKITERHLGLALRPHAFRSIAATTIAEVDPEHANIIRDILGHATLAMSEKHYNRATGISSCNELQSILEDIRKSVPMIGRAKQVLTPPADASDPE